MRDMNCEEVKEVSGGAVPQESVPLIEDLEPKPVPDFNPPLEDV
jgi:hypothetical protein